MGFRTPDLTEAYSAVRRNIAEIRSKYNDGFTQSHCKQELYQLKCWLEDQYNSLPHFEGEEVWEQERIVHLLKEDYERTLDGKI
jgi:hypothetical protein